MLAKKARGSSLTAPEAAERESNEGDMTGSLEDFNPLMSGTPSSGQMECNVVTLPAEFAVAQKEVEEPPEESGTSPHAFLLPIGFPVNWFKPPSSELRNQIHSLHIEAIFNGIRVKRVLVDNGATVNVLPLKVFKKMGYDTSELTKTDITVSGFNGRTSKCLGVFPFRLKIGSQEKETAFFVIELDASFNALLGRDWLHKAGAIPSTLHREMLVWEGHGLEVISADNTVITNQEVMRAGNPRIKVADLSLKQRHELGDPTVGTLGEPSGKFDYLVSYDARPKPEFPIVPTGWDSDEQEGKGGQGEQSLEEKGVKKERNESPKDSPPEGMSYEEDREE